MGKLHYITVATKPHRVLDALKQRVAVLDETITVLGQAEDRLIGWEGSCNFGVKLRELYDFLARPELDPEDIILFTDAYDVVYCGNRQEVLDRYAKFQTPVVFGAERLCQPDTPLANHYPKHGQCEFSYLNSGMFIGKVWALRKCMEGYVFVDEIEDQRFWTEKFLMTHRHLIELDYENLLFLNTVSIDMKWFSVDKFGPSSTIIMYKTAAPLFVHVNGPDKTLIDSLI